MDTVYAALERAGCDPKGTPGQATYITARCPAHDDSNASFQLSEGDDGRALVKCFAGCEATEVVASLHLEWEALFPPREEPRVPQLPAREVAHYTYHDEERRPLFQVVRMEPKSFRQRRWEGGRWQWGLGETRRVLYRLPEVLEALETNRVLFVVEGEKDADRLRELGHAATTLPGGAGKWRDEYTASLVGSSHRIVVIGDDDSVGHKHAIDVWRRLTGKVGQVVARLPAEGFKDISEQLDAGVPFTSTMLRPIPALQPAAGEQAADGPLMLTARAMASRPKPKQELQVVGPLMQRGMRTTIGAGTGEGKTTIALQAIRSLVFREHWLDEAWVPPRPGRALVIDLEQGEETLKRRIREAGLDDTDAVDVLWEPSGLALDQDASHQALVRDVIARGKYDLVLADPLYQMHRGNAIDERLAADLMRVLDGWAREFNFALVIPMHARKPHPQAGKQMTIHDIAGSGAWNRNAEFVLGLQMMSTGTSRMWFFKDRIGDGPSLQSKWWLAFDREKGFVHTADPNEKRAMLKALLARPEGVTEAELEAAGADQVFMRRVRKDAHPNGDRWRSEPWHEQTTLSTDGMT